MKKATAEMISEIKQIHQQYLAEVGSAKAVSEMCGISCQTIYQWRSDLKKSKFKSLTVVDGPPKSTTVTVPNPKADLGPKEQSATLTVITPSGFTIKGLRTSEVIEILQKLGVR